MAKKIYIITSVLLLLVLFVIAGCGGSSSSSNPLTNTAANFSVVVGSKIPADPNYGLGMNIGFVINGNTDPVLTLKRGVTYTFAVNAPAHLFFITSDPIGGSTAGEVTDGVLNSPVENGVLTFTPNSNHPDLLYYQCALHQYMGWKIIITN